MSPEIAALSPELRMRSYIQRVATGPELGKSISKEEAKDAMQSILADLIDPVQSAIYLIALRMKRETDDEFIGSLLGLRSTLNVADAKVDELVDISDPFDGFCALRSRLHIFTASFSCTWCSSSVTRGREHWS